MATSSDSPGSCNPPSRAGKAVGIFSLISAEPAMFLFMCSALAKFPVFQSLLYEKACLNSGRFNATTCQNITAIHADLALQKEANHLLLASSFCLLLPSIFAALLLGALFDSWSSRKSLLIPLAGLLLADLNYILQSLYPACSAYWLLLSDLFFGFSGGFTSIIGLLFAYSVRVTPLSFRSSRVALMEGSMGLGSMCGYILSGHLRQNFGYAWVFLLLTFFHLLVLLYVLLFVRELVSSPPSSSSPQMATTAQRNEQAQLDSGSLSSSSTSSNENQQNGGGGTKVWYLCRNRLLDILRVYRAQREPKKQKSLNIILVAFAVELTCFAGLMDILFSFLRFQLRWTDKEYGLFNGISTGLASFCVILFYPILQKRVGISDLRLSLFGHFTKIMSILILAFTKSTLLAMLSIIPSIFGRFVSTGLRAMASACVSQHEQGKVFSLISLLEAIAFLVASFLFNGLYPYTLSFFPGTMLIAISLLLLIPIGLLIFMDLKRLNRNASGDEFDQPT